MKACLFFCFALVVLSFAKTNWALIVAGSNGWDNYRHQADVSHMHTLLFQHGFDPKHIIDMQYDDIADHPSNPQKGTLINKPNGKNVYPGHQNIDYKGDGCTAENFYNILTGKKTPQTPKVIESTGEDNIFVFYSDHGGPGMVSMPVGGSILASTLNEKIQEMHEKKKYHQMVFYIEACHAGSMFDSTLPSDIQVYATTAADPYESSYAEYCDEPKYGTCLGDEYSIHFMEDLDQADYEHWTMEQQYNKVKEQTTNSHVQQYGETDLMNPQPVQNFFAFKKFRAVRNPTNPTPSSRIPQRDVNLMSRWRRFLDAENSEEKALAYAEYKAEAQMRTRADLRMKRFAALLGHDLDDLMTYKRNTRSPAALLALDTVYEKHCGRFNDYTYGTHNIAITNAINAASDLLRVKDALVVACRE